MHDLKLRRRLYRQTARTTGDSAVASVLDDLERVLIEIAHSPSEVSSEQLDDLRQTTSLLGSNHGSAAQAFYAHLAQGANPQMLLADLKGQLDLLAIRMAQRGV